jgi:hypothetical protein
MALPITTLPKYKTTLPISGETVTYRPFTVREEKILLMAANSDQESDKLEAASQIITNCTFSTLNVEKLSYVDIQWILTTIRGKSVGDKVIVSHTCDCGTENSVEIDLTKMQLSNEAPETKIMLNEEVGLIMQFPSVSTIKSMQDSNKSEDDLMVDFMVQSIESIFDTETVYKASETSIEELQEFVLNLTHEQSTLLKDFFDKIPRLEINRKYKCKKCGKSHEIKVDAFENFTS